MKRQKYNFNQLLLRYHKYRRKLARLMARNQNVHRQQVLRKHILHLIDQMSAMNWKISKQKMVAAAFAGAISFGAQGQPEYIDNHINTFGLNFNAVNSYFAKNLAIADLDNDGDSDIMVLDLDYSGASMVYIENGGTSSTPDFLPQTNNPFGLSTISGYGNGYATFVDLDDDGDYDFVVNFNSYYGTSGVYYYENTGSAAAPAFAAPQIDPFGIAGANTPTGTTFADLDNDGDLDMGIIGVNEIQYFENTGTSTSPAFATGTTLGNQGAVDGQFFDYDNDGDYDILGFFNRELQVVENTGTAASPSFGTSVLGGYGLNSLHSNLYGLSLVDLEADGDMDILHMNPEGDFFYWENTGAVGAPFYTDGHTDLFGLINDAQSHGFGDLDNDGDMDMIAVDLGADFAYYENTGDAQNPNFAAAQSNPFNLPAPGGYPRQHPTLADIDNDGDLDLFCASYNDGLLFFENTGTASAPGFAAGVIDAFGVDMNSLKPNLKDLDNDGDLDLLANNGTAILYWENTGTASAPVFAAYQSNPFGIAAQSFQGKSVLADIDGDGDYDLIHGEQSNTPGFAIQENTGTASAPQFTSSVSNPYLLRAVGRAISGNFLNDPCLVDLDADGDLDIMSYLEPMGRYTYFENDFNCALNSNISLSGVTLTSDQAGATYQWVDCNNGNAPINGATNQSFTPTFNGNYACEVTYLGCTEISGCVSISTIGLHELDEKGITVSPNPGSDQITVQSDAKIERVLIFDMMGNLLITSPEASLSVAQLATGTYTISVQTEKDTIQKRFVKM